MGHYRLFPSPCVETAQAKSALRWRSMLHRVNFLCRGVWSTGQVASGLLTISELTLAVSIENHTTASSPPGQGATPVLTSFPVISFPGWKRAHAAGIVHHRPVNGRMKLNHSLNLPEPRSTMS